MTKWMPILRIGPKVTWRDDNAGNTARFCDKVGPRDVRTQVFSSPIPVLIQEVGILIRILFATRL